MPFQRRVCFGVQARGRRFVSLRCRGLAVVTSPLPICRLWSSSSPLPLDWLNIDSLFPSHLSFRGGSCCKVSVLSTFAEMSAMRRELFGVGVRRGRGLFFELGVKGFGSVPRGGVGVRGEEWEEKGALLSV